MVNDREMRVAKRTSRNLPARVAVMGAARSGLAAARYLHDQGVSVFVSDTCPRGKLEFLLASNGLAQVAHEAEEHTERVLDYDAIVLSPGIRSDHWLLRLAHRRGIPVWSEIELGFRRSVAEFLAVTGSSGKSTTVSMLGSIVEASGRPGTVAGNIGIPLVSVAPRLPADAVAVVEVSSFQLENIDAFKPRVALVLNLMKNHLDRYAREQDYYRAKMEIARNLDPSCDLVVDARDERLVRWAMEVAVHTNIAFFGCRKDAYRSVWHEKGAIVAAWPGVAETLLDVSSMKVTGGHNYDNAAAAGAVALAAGLAPEHIAAGLAAFEGLPHRLQHAGTYGGVSWYNDSKSTTAESVRVAIVAFGGNAILIAGGRDKGCDFTVVNDVLTTHVKHVVLLGEAADRMQSVWSNFTPITRARTLDDAIEAAGGVAEPGDTVVFSPGCSSFDMFSNYEERGLAFMAAVRDKAPALVRRHRGGGRA